MMMLRSIRLRNFRKFQDAFVEFPEGVTAVVGLNGAGKSTLFEAVAWVLFGAVAARTSTNQLRRQDAGVSEVCRVELSFLLSGQEYVLVREIRGKSLVQSASVVVDGRLAAEGGSAVSAFMQRQLGMDYKSFYTSVFARQKELNALSSMNPSDRRPLILRLLGVDALDGVLERIRVDKKGLDKLVSSLDREILDVHGRRRVEIIQDKIHDIEINAKELKKKEDERLHLVEGIQMQVQDAQDVALRSREKYEQLRSDREVLEDVKTKVKRRDDLLLDLVDIEKRVNREEKELTRLKGLVNQEEKIKKDKKELESSIKGLEGELEKISENSHELQARESQIDRDLRMLMQKKSRLEKLGPKASCPTCERVLGDQYELLHDHFSVDIKQLSDERSQVALDVKKIGSKRGEVRQKQSKLREQLVEVDGELLELQRTTAKVSELLERLDERKQRVERIKLELQPLKGLVFDEKSYLKSKDVLDQAYGKWQGAEKQVNVFRETLSKEKIAVERILGEKKVLVEKKKSLNERLDELKKLEGQVALEKKRLGRLEALYELMARFRVYMIGQIRPTLGFFASELIGLLTDGKYVQVELDEEYNLIVYDEGESFGIERFSGGEEDLVNLCMRLAISEVLSERSGSVFHMVVLDEIFGSQDMLRRRNIVRALSGFTGKFRQIFVITHLEEVKSMVDHVISVSEDENGHSCIRLE